MKGQNINITEYLFEFARTNPDKAALLHPEEISFSGFCTLIDKYATGFLGKGVKEGTKSIVLVSPGLDLFVIVFALLRIGAIPILIDPGMGNKAMAAALSRTEAEVFIGIPKAHLLRLFFRRSFKTIHKYFSSGKTGLMKSTKLPHFRKLENFKSKPYHGDPGETAAIFFTSGSTGPAKAVIYENRMLHAQIRYMKDHFKYSADTVDLCTFPLIGLLVICHGISIVLADMDMTQPKKMDTGKVIKNINSYGCSSMFCSPMVLGKLANYCMENKIRLQALKKVYTAGAPVSPELLRSFRGLLDVDAVIHTPFGSTEALSISDIESEELLSIYSETNSYLNGICVGTPLTGIDIRIIEISDDPIVSIENVSESERGEIGEIIVRGPNVTQAYFRNAPANENSKIADKNSNSYWHRTGDLGKFDKAGRIWYCGRKSQRVLIGEQTYFTIPCEAVFNQHPTVQRSALVGVDRNGDKIPLICIEVNREIKHSKDLKEELLSLAREYENTRDIKVILFHRKFPVDPRHNAKINREKLAIWAKNNLQ